MGTVRVAEYTFNAYEQDVLRLYEHGSSIRAIARSTGEDRKWITQLIQRWETVKTNGDGLIVELGAKGEVKVRIDWNATDTQNT